MKRDTKKCKQHTSKLNPEMYKKNIFPQECKSWLVVKNQINGIYHIEKN